MQQPLRMGSNSSAPALAPARVPAPTSILVPAPARAPAWVPAPTSIPVPAPARAPAWVPAPTSIPVPALAPQKCYNPNDSTLKFVDREDELDFLCEGFPSLRAQMSCGHAVTPMSLTKWCLQQLEQGESRFVCGQYGCDAKWSYAEVCKMALLTPEEMRHFRKLMVQNASTGRKCPGCNTRTVRQSDNNLCVLCQVCTTKIGHVYEFCWQCLREWKGPKPRSDRCENISCYNSALETLKTCPDMVFESVEGVMGCPSIRACPTCGSLQEHQGTGCKYIKCSRCRVRYCFVCLRTCAKCLNTSSYFDLCSSGVAHRQTSVPVWKKK